MNKSRVFLLLLFLLFACAKSDKSIYELKPDAQFYYLLKENEDSIKITAEPYQLDYSRPKFLTISRFNSNVKKFEVESVCLWPGSMVLRRQVALTKGGH